MSLAASSSASARNRALYDSFWSAVPHYPRYNPGARHRRRLLFELLARLPGDRLLDVGCGDGLLLRLLGRERTGARLAGADLSPAQVARNRAQVPGVDFHELDIEKACLPLTFDGVICSEVIEHVEDQRAAFEHLAAMVAPGGWLVVTCPTGTLYATERHFGHVHHPTREELLAHGKHAGLEPTHLANWGWPAYRLLKWATNVRPRWALRHFATGSYSTAARMLSSGLFWVNYLNLGDDPRGCQLIAVFRRAP